MDKEVVYFQVKAFPLPIDQYGRSLKQGLQILRDIGRKTKRKPYIRSKYFNNQKVFLSVFLSHLFDKNSKIRQQRTSLIPCVIELVEKCTVEPMIKIENNASLYRFYGITKTGCKFAVQIKQSRKGAKYLISTFPVK